LGKQVDGGNIAGLRDCLLAFQFCERDEDGFPSERARLGATWQAEQHLRMREIGTLVAALAGAGKGR